MQNTLSFNLPVPISLKYKLSLKKFLIINLILSIGLLFFYIFQINKTFQISYLVKDFEGSLKQISQENKNLEDNLLKSNSLGDIETLARNLNYERITDIKYIQIIGSSVVAK